ncbi:hypothetical protein [Streptomyces sundarbansensis]
MGAATHPLCRIASQADRDRILAEFHTARTAAVAAQEGRTYDQKDEDAAHQARAGLIAQDEAAAHQEAAARAEQHRQEQARTARQQAEDDETARIRAELAARYADLAAVSASTQEAQEAQQSASAPF